MCPVTRFFAVETILSFWGELESFDKKVWPVTHFFCSADYLKFLLGLGKFRQKKCDQLHVFSLWRLTWVFVGTWKNFHKKVCPVICFFAVETNLSFWWDLGKTFTKKCAQSHVSSLWRLTWVFDGTWKNFHKKVCPVTRFFAVETYLKFLRGLGKFRQKGVTSYTFFSQCKLSYVFDETWKVSKRRCDQYHGFSQCRLTWVFDGTWKNVHKKVCPVTRFFAVETSLSFWWDLEKFPRKSVPSHTFLRCGDFLRFLRGLGKFRQRGVTSYTFFCSADYLKFLMGLGKFRQNKCDQLHVSFSLWRLTWVFDGTWKTFHKKVCPVTRFVRCGD